MDRFDGLLVIGMLLMALGVGLYDARIGIIVLGLECVVFAAVGATAEGRAHQGKIASPHQQMETISPAPQRHAMTNKE